MDRYHHGDLRRQLLDQAAAISADTGPDSVTLRELARRVGVSHSAPVHHFGTRGRLLSELAARGFADLNRALEPHEEDIYGMGVSYVMWGLAHPGEYAVMWQPHRLDDAAAGLAEEREWAWSLLASAASGTVAKGADEETVRAGAYAAFSLVHGLTSLWLSHALPRPDDPQDLTRRITQHLRFGASPHPAPPAV